MYTILIVEDDRAVAQALAKVLCSWGYVCAQVQDFEQVLNTFVGVQPDLVLMDLGLPHCSGLYWTQAIRKISSVPILFISSHDETASAIQALTSGGDDYITKPFDMQVLTLKIQAQLRRAYDWQPNAQVLHAGRLRLFPDSSKAEFDGRQTELSRNECRILKILMENQPRVVEREVIMEAIWNTDCYIDENTLSVNVARLRRKLAAIGAQGCIKTCKGCGYGLETPV